MKGRRVYPREDEKLYLQEGDYGFDPIVGYWSIRPPGCHGGGIPQHTVTEHEDGTITVSPSILLTEYDDENNEETVWHGYLERGVWRAV